MDIGGWLEQIGLGKYASVFVENEIDRMALPDLTEDDLREMGLPIGARRKFFRALQDAANTGPGDAPNTDVSPAGNVERRQITVMFCDLVASTTLSETLDPEELRDVMTAYQKAAGKVVERFAGHVAQYLGDGLMVYFGWPRAHEDDADRAVRAGLELVDAVKAVRAPTPLQVRIGIATGPVVVGETGAGDASVPKAAVGETPNVAARLQALAAPDELVIGPVTQSLVGGSFDYEDLGESVLRGISKPVHAWRVIEASAAEGPFEARAIGGLTPFVGREVEIALLMDRWAEAEAGDGQVVVLSGEPGIGKSRITQVLRERLADVAHTPVRYQCSPYYLNSALYPIIDQLERAADFAHEDPAPARLDKLEALLARGNVDPMPVVPLVAALMSLPVDRYPALALSAQRQKETTIEVLVDQAVGLARQRPVLMIFEDAHWADPTTLELLGVLIDRMRSAPLLLVITCRPEFELPWGGYSHVTSHSLNRLSRRLGARLVAEVPGGRTLPGDVLDQIIAKTDGVPLFVEELTKTVLEAGIADTGSGSSAVNPAAAIPATLQDSLTARLDRLGPAREIAQLGACIGRDFSYRLIAAISEFEKRALDDGLEQLVGAGLLHRHGTPPDATHSFKHALVQETAYQSLLISRRQQIHRHIAQVLDGRLDATVSAEPESIARHYTEAGLPEQAIPYWQQAGQRAAQRSANVEAIGHFTTTLELLQSLPESEMRNLRELELQMALGTATDVSKGFAAPESGRAYARAEALCRELGGRPELVNVLMGLWAFHVSGQSPLDIARGIAEQLLNTARDQDDSTALLKAHIVMPMSLFYQGEFTAAREHLDISLDLYDPGVHHEEMLATSGYDRGVVIHCWAAMNDWMLGYPDRALKSCDKALALAREMAHPYTLAVVHMYAAWVHGWRAELEAACEHAEASISLSDAHGFALTRAWGAIYRSMVKAKLGIGEPRVEDANDAVAMFRKAGIGLWMPHNLAAMAELRSEAGQFEPAMDVLGEGLETTERRGDRFFAAELYRLKGETILKSDGRDPQLPVLENAESCFEKALAIAREQSARSLELRAASSLVRLRLSQGRRDDGRRLLAPIVARFTEGFKTADLENAKALLAQSS